MQTMQTMQSLPTINSYKDLINFNNSLPKASQVLDIERVSYAKNIITVNGETIGIDRFLYNYIKNHHLLDKYCSKMKFRRTPRGYWNLERAIAVIPECRSRKELQKNHPQAYNILNKARMLDKYYPNNSWKIKWTLERSMSVIPLCNSRKELQKKYVRAYQVLLKAGLLDDYFPLKWKPFSTEKKIAIITNCKTRIELHNRHRTVYDWASKNGLLDKYFPMKRKL